MADVVEAGLLGDVLEMALAVILEEDVSAPHGRDVEVRVAVVVDVREGGRDADAILQCDAGLLGDVRELAVAEVPPELVAAELVDEVNVEQAVAVDIGHRDAVSVVVVVRLVVLAGVVGDAVKKGDSAFGLAIRKVEVMEHAELASRLLLRGLARGEAVGPRIHCGNANLLAVVGTRVRPCSHRDESRRAENDDGAGAEPERPPPSHENFHNGTLFYRRGKPFSVSFQPVVRPSFESRPTPLLRVSSNSRGCPAGIRLSSDSARAASGRAPPRRSARS